MTMKASARTTSIQPPPIALVMDRVREMRAAGARVISMAQAAPWYCPPAESLELLASRLGDPRTSAYCPDEGLPGTREAVAADFLERRGIRLDPETELHMTVGASQAFLGALLSVTDPGDRVMLVEPWYFDHEFAARFAGLRVDSAAMSVRGGRWVFPADEIVSKLPGCRCLVIVNPGNPTGAVLSQGEIGTMVEECGRSGTFLLLDETYERFDFTGAAAHPWAGARPDHLLTFGSFSKSLGMPGWRLGYLFGRKELLAQALKVQDAAVICPPVPSQILLESAIGIRGWVEERAAGVRMRLDTCRRAVRASGALDWVESEGAFFAMAGLPPGTRSREGALELLREHGLATIPGSAFGPAGEGFLRLSFGCLGDGEIEPAMLILSAVGSIGRHAMQAGPS